MDKLIFYNLNKKNISKIGDLGLGLIIALGLPFILISISRLNPQIFFFIFFPVNEIFIISFPDFLSIRQKLVHKQWRNDIYICSSKDGLQIYISFLHCLRTNFCLVLQKKSLYFPILDFQNILHI